MAQERTFIRIYREGLIEDILTRKINLNEFGLLQWLFIRANSHNGILLTNFSALANELNETPDAIRYLADKLKTKGYIYYQTKQGQKVFTKFHLNRFPLPNRTYTDLTKMISEVESSIPKPENASNPDKSKE